MSAQTVSSEVPAGKAEMPFFKVVLYSLGSAAGLFLYNTFNSFIQFFYTDAVGLPAQWVGRGWFAFGLWNAANDPLVGWLADSKKSKSGRRTWFIRALAIPVAVAFMAVWLPPFNVADHGATTVLVYFLIIISVYDLMQSMITLCIDALFPEMFQQAASRLRSAVTVTVIGSVLGGIAVALAPMVYGSRLGWAGLGVIWGVIGASFYLVSLWGIHENPKYAEAETVSLRERLRLVLQNRTFLIIVGLNICFRLILAALVTALPFYAEYVLQVGGGGTSTLVMVFVGSYTLATLLWQFVYRRYGTRQTVLISLSVFSVVSLPAIVVTSLPGAMVVVALIGIGLGALLMGAHLLFADMIDEDFVKTGVRREGLYRGMLGFVYRLPPAFSGLLLGELLAWSGYNSALNPAEQPGQVATSIRYFIALLPVIAALSGAVLAYLYPLYGERLKTIQSEAQRLNAEFEE